MPVIPASNWVTASGGEHFLPGGKAGCAHLTSYTVEYREWGSGAPLVLVPGLAGGMQLLGPLIRILKSHFRVITYQLRGEDNCFALRRPFGLDDLVEDLHELVDTLRLESPTIMGVSFGGVLALEYAARYPYRLENLIVQGTGARFEPGLMQRVAKTVLSRFPLPNDNPFINQFFNLLFGRPQKQNSLFHFVTRQCWQTDQSVMAHRLKLLEGYDMQPRLGRIRVPSLILVGKRDVFVSPNSLQLLSQELEKACVIRLPSSGHLASITHPRMVADLAHRFCRDGAGTLVR